MEYKEFKPVIIATIVMIAMLGALCIATSVPLASAAAPGTPFQVGGHVYLGTATGSGADVTVTDLNTGEFLTTTTDSNGAYVVSLGNLPSGHCAGDTIHVTATYNGHVGYNSEERSEYLSDAPQIIDVTIESIVSPTPAVEETPPPLEVFSGGCEDLDQYLLMRYDFDNNGLIDGYEMEKAYIGYESNYEKQSDYDQILYAYEHSCSVGSIASPTPAPPATVQPTPTATPAVTATAQPTPTTVVTPTPTKPMFRVGPTVVLRPVNDVIDKSQNGLVELYMNNPSLNDVTLTADIQISVPSGIHISGDGFGYGGAAGVVAGTFTVPPGTVRTININIRGEKTGVFTIHFTGLYWADGDKDAFQQVSLTHRLTVTDPDIIETPVPVPTEANTPSPDTGPVNNTESDSIPTTYIVIGMGMLVVLLIIVIAARK